MKIHPLLKSAIVIGIVFHFTSGYFFNKNMHLIQERQRVLFYLIFSALISISYFMPFLFFKKSSFKKTLISILFSIIFLGALFYTMENEEALVRRLFEIMPKEIKSYFPFHPVQIAFFCLFPLSLYFISNFFVKVDWKLLVLNSMIFPSVIFFESFFQNSFFSKLFTEPSAFSFLLFANIASCLYLLIFQKKTNLIIDGNILDSPDL